MAGIREQQEQLEANEHDRGVSRYRERGEGEEIRNAEKTREKYVRVNSRRIPLYVFLRSGIFRIIFGIERRDFNAMDFK